MSDNLRTLEFTAAECTIPDEVKDRVRALVLARAADSADMLAMLGLEE